MNLNNTRIKLTPILSAIFLLAFFVNPSVAATVALPRQSTPVLHTSSVDPVVMPLDSSFNPNVGGAPFCSSGSLGTILCYPPSFLKKAYNFPASLTGAGSTIVIVDAFGSPTIQSDLNTYDTAFGIPSTTVTILCGPTWTGSGSDSCPLNTLADIPVVGGTPGGIACGGVGGVEGWIGETTLDVTMAHSLAPAAHIVLVVGNDCFDTSLYSAEYAVVSQSAYKGSVMSQSFGEPDDLVTCTAIDSFGNCIARDPTILNQPNAVFALAQANHWTVIASSGDEGANTAAVFTGTIEMTPSFPATSPLVLAAGGTQGSPYGGQFGAQPGPGGVFTCAAGATCNTGLVVINGGASGCSTAVRPGQPTSCIPVGYGGESTWQEVLNFGLTGGSVGYTSGGGFSSLYGIPSYQKSVTHTFTTLLGNSTTATGRMTPDVSFNSAVYGGVLAYLGYLGRWAVFGGTSAASPAWAGIIALANQANGKPLGFVNPLIYGIMGQNSQGTNPFHDITQGNNAICSGLCGEDGFLAGKGYDMTTGFGTPNVARLISTFTQDHQ